jgi:exodeoxyribonuclease V beta subunit
LSYAYKNKNITTPDYFLKLLQRVRNPDVKIIPEIAKPELRSLADYRRLFRTLQKAWPASRDTVKEHLKDPALSGTIYGGMKSKAQTPDMTGRELKVMVLMDRMDRFVSDESAGYPLFKDFDKFSASKLNRSVKKNHQPPSHEIFGICERLIQKDTELQAQMARYLIFLKAEFFRFAEQELSKKKRRKNVQFYDDLLLSIRKALIGGTRAGDNLIAKTIRQKYKAALVDEFQDTDAIQYDIFSMLFASNNSLLFMIGDPKQSIYSFRGADIFSYMKAAGKVQSKYTLSGNWRSDPGLIAAVNTIFCNVKKPFVFHEIPFERGESRKKAVLTSGLPGAAFKLWYLPGEGKKPLNKSDAVRSITEAMSGEILRLISPESEPVRPGDIAVLVRTNRQAQMVKESLTAKHIPAILYSTGNIFDTAEAAEIQQILASIAEPDNRRLFRSAWATDMLGGGGQEFDFAEQEPLWWQRRSVSFRQYLDLWRKYGFIRMFRNIMVRENVKQRLLSWPDGERRLTNTLHLAEIIHQISLENKLGISALLKWLSDQRFAASPRMEEHQLRLESDELAVKIVTIHKSKGLEYPIVFCPFGWEPSVIKDQEIIFHGTDAAYRLTLDLDAQKNGPHMQQAQIELLAENLRLLYVALTRAKSRCYLIWGRVNTAETSALAYLLHDGARAEKPDVGDDFIGRLADEFSSLSEVAFVDDLQRLAEKSKGTIELARLPRAQDEKYAFRPGTREKLSCKQFKGKIDKSWRISSYSALISKRAIDSELPDYDGLKDYFSPPGDYLSEFSEGHTDGVQSPGKPNIFSFPKGARSGIFFHDVFENLDVDGDRLEKIITGKLQEYGFDRFWKSEILHVVDNVLNVPLVTENEDFVLASVTRENRIHEVEFYFPLHPVGPRDLAELFAKHRGVDMETDFAERLGDLTFTPAGGYMRGYIDMVFNHRGRFYLVDWKSNYLGGLIEDYHPKSLTKTMNDDYYFLQYHLYTLALHQYLQVCDPEYTYEKKFGGVFYVFLRGVNRHADVQYGIFHDRPAQDFIFDLGKALIPGFSSGE